VVRLPRLVIGPRDMVPGGWEGTLDSVLLAAWGAATLLLLGRWQWQRRQLQRARRSWQPADVDGCPILLAGDAGPAVLGGRRAAIVLPRWVLALPQARRQLILRHEREHLRAGDARLQEAMHVARILVPWNPVFWYVERRLRAAIEVDCDRRVLRAAPVDRRVYGALLVQVAGRAGHPMHLMPSLSESYTLIARRITVMSRSSKRPTFLPLIAVSVAVVALVAACSTEAPTAADPTPTGVQTVGPWLITASSDTVQNPDGAYFEFQVEAPAQFAGGAAVRFPDAQRKAGIEGEVLAQFIVDSTGLAEVGSYKVLKATDPAFSEAVKRALPGMRFTPARVKGRAVRQLVQAPFSFAIAK